MIYSLNNELHQAFISDPLAVQIAGFNHIDFDDKSWARVEAVNHGDWDSPPTVTIYFVVGASIVDRHALVGLPCQQFQRAAHLVREFSKKHRNEIITFDSTPVATNPKKEDN